MMNLPAIELLEATHRFPGPYTFKAIGNAAGGFAEAVTTAVCDTLGEGRTPRFSIRASSGGRHVAVTIEARLRDAGEVHDVYRRLTTIPGVLVLL